MSHNLKRDDTLASSLAILSTCRCVSEGAVKMKERKWSNLEKKQI